MCVYSYNALYIFVDSRTRVDRAEGFQVDVTARLMRQLSLTDRQTSINSEDEDFEKWGHFGTLSVSTLNKLS